MSAETTKTMDRETATTIADYLNNAFEEAKDTLTRVKELWEATDEISTEDAWAVKIATIRGRAAYTAMTILHQHGTDLVAFKAEIEAEINHTLSLPPEIENLIPAKVFNEILACIE